MTDWVVWFRYQLQASADGFAWAFSQIPLEMRESLPPRPKYLGTWPPARHVWHVTEYERCLVIPSMNQWLGAPLPANDAWLDDDDTWAKFQNREIEETVDVAQWTDKIIAVARIQSVTEKYIRMHYSHDRIIYWEYEGGLALMESLLKQAELLLI